MSEVATLAGGCFWCSEAVFRRLRGVSQVTSGYTGGVVKNPSYAQVCTGTTGHAEAVQVEFEPKTVTFETILEVFFATHDPTTLNRQDNDIGTQYRSAIFYHNSEQKKEAESAVVKIERATTQIVPYKEFYPATVDHQQYFEINGKAPYCSYVIKPKIQKLLEKYGELVDLRYINIVI